MADLPLTTGALAREGDSGSEDTAAALAGLDCAGDEGAAVADALDVEENWRLIAPSQEEVAVATVDDEVVRNRLLRCGKALGDDHAAEDAAGSGWAPCLARVGENVLRGELEAVGVGRWA